MAFYLSEFGLYLSVGWIGLSITRFGLSGLVLGGKIWEGGLSIKK